MHNIKTTLLLLILFLTSCEALEVIDETQEAINETLKIVEETQENAGETQENVDEKDQNYNNWKIEDWEDDISKYSK